MHLKLLSIEEKLFIMEFKLLMSELIMERIESVRSFGCSSVIAEEALPELTADDEAGFAEEGVGFGVTTGDGFTTFCCMTGGSVVQKPAVQRSAPTQSLGE